MGYLVIIKELSKPQQELEITKLHASVVVRLDTQELTVKLQTNAQQEPRVSLVRTMVQQLEPILIVPVPV